MNQTVLNIGEIYVSETNYFLNRSWHSGTQEPNPARALPYLHVQVDEPTLSLASDAASESWLGIILLITCLIYNRI